MKIKLLFASIVTVLLIAILLTMLADRFDRQKERRDQLAREQALAVAFAESEQVRKNADAETKKQELLEKLDKYEQAGIMTHEKAQESRDFLTGKRTLYVAPDGFITTNPVSVVPAN